MCVCEKMSMSTSMSKGDVYKDANVDDNVELTVVS